MNTLESSINGDKQLYRLLLPEPLSPLIISNLFLHLEKSISKVRIPIPLYILT